MRLNRLLRAGSASASTPPQPGALTAPATGKRGFTNTGFGNTNAKSGLGATAEDDPGTSSNLSGVVPYGIGDTPRELFGTSPAGQTGSPAGYQLARGKGSFDASRTIGSRREEQDDDLEDISDGGFHSGCWKRKYVRGEMR